MSDWFPWILFGLLALIFAVLCMIYGRLQQLVLMVFNSRDWHR